MPTNEPTNPPPQFVDVFELRFIGAALRRHGWVVLAVGVLGALLGAGFSAMSTPAYRAQAVLLVNIQTLKIGLDGVPMDVELMRPARRIVGTVCTSDQAMSILAERLDETLLSEVAGGQPERISWLSDRLYYDQRGIEMATLRAVASDPEQAARLANAWAEVCRELLCDVYGTTPHELQEIEAQAAEAKQHLLVTRAALAELPDDATQADRLESSDALDKAQRLMSAVNERWAYLQVRLSDSEEIARISSPALPPVESINPSLRLTMGLFGFAGLSLGLAIALLRGPAVRARG